MANKFRVDTGVFDAVGVVVGFLALEYGLAQWSGPVAWVVGGVCLIVAAFAPDVRKAKR